MIDKVTLLVEYFLAAYSDCFGHNVSNTIFITLPVADAITLIQESVKTDVYPELLSKLTPEGQDILSKTIKKDIDIEFINFVLNDVGHGMIISKIDNPDKEELYRSFNRKQLVNCIYHQPWVFDFSLPEPDDPAFNITYLNIE